MAKLEPVKKTTYHPTITRLTRTTVQNLDDSDPHYEIPYEHPYFINQKYDEDGNILLT